MIIRMFPPFPIPGFAPNFTGYDLDQHGIDWYEMYKSMAQHPDAAVYWVSFTSVHDKVGKISANYNVKTKFTQADVARKAKVERSKVKFAR